MAAVVLWVLVAAFMCVSAADAELQRLLHDHPALKPDSSLTFLVIGDWGRKGTFNQSQVAIQVLICYACSN